jgi:hypothetical protein
MLHEGSVGVDDDSHVRVGAANLTQGALGLGHGANTLIQGAGEHLTHGGDGLVVDDRLGGTGKRAARRRASGDEGARQRLGGGGRGAGRGRAGRDIGTKRRASGSAVGERRIEKAAKTAYEGGKLVRQNGASAGAREGLDGSAILMMADNLLEAGAQRRVASPQLRILIAARASAAALLAAAMLAAGTPRLVASKESADAGKAPLLLLGEEVILFVGTVAFDGEAAKREVMLLLLKKDASCQDAGQTRCESGSGHLLCGVHPGRHQDGDRHHQDGDRHHHHQENRLQWTCWMRARRPSVDCCSYEAREGNMLDLFWRGAGRGSTGRGKAAGQSLSVLRKKRERGGGRRRS